MKRKQAALAAHAINSFWDELTKLAQSVVRPGGPSKAAREAAKPITEQLKNLPRGGFGGLPKKPAGPPVPAQTTPKKDPTAPPPPPAG